VLVWLLATHVLRLPQPSSQAAVLLAAQPTGVNVFLLSTRYAAARELATTTVFLSTVISLLTVSLVVYLLPSLG
jgi:malonate transporter